MGTAVGARKRLAGLLAKRFFVRFHFSLILAFAVTTGVLATKGFLALGLDTMHWRWPLALVAAYLAFLLGVRAWLGYIGLGPYLDRGTNADIPDPGLDRGGSGDSGIGDLVGEGIGRAMDHGGNFGGGGASGDFGAAVADSAPDSSLLPDVGLPDVSIDADEGCLPILIGLLILAFLAAALGVGVYVIWQAPSILAEASFEGALAAGLVKSARRIDDPGWVGGTLRASWLPFLVIFLCALVVAGLAEHFAPQARTLPEALRLLLQ